jgi:hypothetical protein
MALPRIPFNEGFLETIQAKAQYQATIAGASRGFHPLESATKAIDLVLQIA